jgi:hypothetical protein
MDKIQFTDSNDSITLIFSYSVAEKDRKNSVCSVFNKKMLEVSFPLSKGREFANIYELYDEVDKNINVTYNENTIVIIAKKLTPKLWPSFNKKEKVCKDSFARKVDVCERLYKKDEIVFDEKRSDAKDDSLFLDQIGRGTDDDGKRAALKSYYESGGVSLSTDWSTAKDKNFAEDRLKYSN